MQPWLDYFAMLQTFERKGLLEVKADRREAYATQAALLVLLGMDGATLVEDLSDWRRLAYASAGLLRRLRGYAGFRSQEGARYLKGGFALHVVKDEPPHDLLCTLLLSSRRRWWRLWKEEEDIDVIDYGAAGDS